MVDSSVPGALGAWKCQLGRSNSSLSICHGWFWARLVGKRGRQAGHCRVREAALMWQAGAQKSQKGNFPVLCFRFSQLLNGGGVGIMLIFQRLFK